MTSSFTLLDFSNESDRMAYVQTLWDRVEPNGYLVLTEVGTKSGFQTMLEARDVLIHLFKDTPGYIFAPVKNFRISSHRSQRYSFMIFLVSSRESMSTGNPAEATLLFFSSVQKFSFQVVLQ